MDVQQGSGDAESGHQQRLTGALAELLRQHGHMRAAAELGVGYQTLRRSLSAGRLSPRLRTAIERHLILRDSIEVPDSPWAVRLAEVEKRVDEIEQRAQEHASAIEETRSSLATLRQELERKFSEVEKALEKGHAAGRDLEQRLEQIARTLPNESDSPASQRSTTESGGAGSSGPAMAADMGQAGLDEKSRGLLDEWRAVENEEARARTRLDRVKAAGRRLEIELTLIREHGISIPPEESWPPAIRSRGLSWRRDALEDRRRERRRLEFMRWIRRAATLGLWWE